MTSVDTT